MPENFVAASDFNATMHALRGEIREDLAQIREEIGSLRAMLQVNFDYRVEQAKVTTDMSSRINTLEERLRNYSKLFFGVGVTVGSLLVWEFLKLAARR